MQVKVAVLSVHYVDYSVTVNPTSTTIWDLNMKQLRDTIVINVGRLTGSPVD